MDSCNFNPQPKESNRAGAFSLLETVITLAIVAVVMAMLSNVLISSILISQKSIARSFIREEVNLVVSRISEDVRTAARITDCTGEFEEANCTLDVEGEGLVTWKLCGNANGRPQICRIRESSGEVVFSSSQRMIVEAFGFELGFVSSENQSRRDILVSVVGSHDLPALEVNNISTQTTLSTRNYILTIRPSIPPGGVGTPPPSGTAGTECVVGYLSTNSLYPGGYISNANAQASVPENGVLRSLRGFSDQVTSTFLQGMKILYVGDIGTTLASQRRALSNAELELIREAYLNGMSIVVAGDNGVSGATDASQAARQITNYIQSKFVYENTVPAVTETAYLSKTTNAASWGPDIPFVTSRPIDLRVSYRTPGIISGSSALDPDATSCFASVVVSNQNKCVLAYLPPKSGSGFLLISGNADRPFTVPLTTITKAACGIPADACVVRPSMGSDLCSVASGNTQTCHYRDGVPRTFAGLASTSQIYRAAANTPDSRVNLFMHWSLNNSTIPVDIGQKITSGKDVVIVTDDCAATGGHCGGTTTPSGAKAFAAQYGVNLQGNISLNGFAAVTETETIYSEYKGLTRMLFTTPSYITFTGIGPLAPLAGQVKSYSCQYRYLTNCIWATVKLKSGSQIHFISSTAAADSWYTGGGISAVFYPTDAGNLMEKLAGGTCAPNRATHCTFAATLQGADVCPGSGPCHFTNGFPRTVAALDKSSTVQRVDPVSPVKETDNIMLFNLTNQVVPASFTNAINIERRNVTFVTDNCGTGNACANIQAFTRQYGVDVLGNDNMNGTFPVKEGATFEKYKGLTQMLFNTPGFMNFTQGSGSLSEQVQSFTCQYFYTLAGVDKCVWGTIRLNAGNYINIITSVAAVSGRTNTAYLPAVSAPLLEKLVGGTCQL